MQKLIQQKQNEIIILNTVTPEVDVGKTETKSNEKER